MAADRRPGFAKTRLPKRTPAGQVQPQTSSGIPPNGDGLPAPPDPTQPAYYTIRFNRTGSLLDYYNAFLWRTVLVASSEPPAEPAARRQNYRRLPNGRPALPPGVAADWRNNLTVCLATNQPFAQRRRTGRA